MICPQCGNNNPEKAKVCRRCGYRLFDGSEKEEEKAKNAGLSADSWSAKWTIVSGGARIAAIVLMSLSVAFLAMHYIQLFSNQDIYGAVGVLDLVITFTLYALTLAALVLLNKIPAPVLTAPVGLQLIYLSITLLSSLPGYSGLGFTALEILSLIYMSVLWQVIYILMILLLLTESRVLRIITLIVAFGTGIGYLISAVRDVPSICSAWGSWSAISGVSALSGLFHIAAVIVLLFSYKCKPKNTAVQ